MPRRPIAPSFLLSASAFAFAERDFPAAFPSMIVAQLAAATGKLVVDQLRDRVHPLGGNREEAG
jgi:hypothetical protein